MTTRTQQIPKEEVMGFIKDTLYIEDTLRRSDRQETMLEEVMG